MSQFKNIDLTFILGGGAVLLLVIVLPEIPLVNSMFRWTSGLALAVLGFEIVFSFFVFSLRLDKSEVFGFRYNPSLFLVFFAWLAWCVLSAFATTHIAVSLFRIVEVVVHVIFLYAAFSFYRAYPTLALLTRNLFLLGFAIYSIMLLEVWSVFDSWNSTFYTQKIFYGFGHVRHYGYYLLAVLVVSLGLMWRAIYNKYSVSTYVYFILSIAAWAWMFALGGRGPFFAFMLSTIIILLVNREYFNKKFVLLLLVSIIIGLLVSIPISPDAYGPKRLITTLADSDTLDQYSSARLSIWKDALTLVIEHPLFGVGPDGYMYELSRKYPSTIQPHGIIPQTLLEWGVPGGLLFFILILSLFYKLGTKLNHHSGLKLDNLGLFWLILSLFIFSTIDGVLYYSRTVFVFMLFLAILLADLYEQPTEKKCVLFRSAAILVLVISGIVATLHTTTLSAVMSRSVVSLNDKKVLTLQRFPSVLADPSANHMLLRWSSQLNQHEQPKSMIAWYKWLENTSSKPWVFAYLHAELLFQLDRQKEAVQLLSNYRDFAPNEFVYRFDCLEKRYID